MEASAGEAEETTRPSELLRWRRRGCINGSREFMATAVSWLEEDGPEDSATTMEALSEDEEWTIRLRDPRRWRRWQKLDGGPEVSTTTTEAAAEKDDHEELNSYNGGIGGG